MVNYEPHELEKKILKFWEDKKIVDKSLNLRKGKKTFSFMDGPPTANNPMGVHHAWGRTYKDLYLRLRTMQGFDERKQPGFDCQGLWVEVGVEKELGFKTKKDIEDYGIDKFVEKCKKTVLEYIKVWIDLSKKLGMWMDWKNPYLTLTDMNIEYVWYFLKKCNEKGWLYKGAKVLPWCPRCGTSLSSHEVSSGYKTKTHPGIYFKFKIKDRENEYLLVYTTTPWTLVSNVAVAANPDAEYVRVRVNDDYFILGKSLLNSIFPDKNYKVVENFYGRNLVELQYENPMKDLLPIQWNVTGKVILSTEFVSLEEGTGLVHIAPGHGPEDYQLGIEYKLPILSPLDENGKFTEDAGWLKGKTAKEANKIVLETLRERNILFKETAVTHSYPCCWRCDEELIYRTGEEWFISSEEIKPSLIREAEKVVWYPEWTKKSMLDWLKNLKDWNISRKRYYGLPLPIWTCECGYVEVIGGKDELKKKAVKGFDQLKELHRPWIDNVILKCPKCGKELRRVVETGDCWLDAGVVYFSTLYYLDDKKYWSKWFPADFITEMHEQVRLWFYATLFVSVTLEDKTPYRSVLAHGMVLDEKNKEEMHKSAGNVIWADEALEKMGGDIIRWMYCLQNPSQPLPFGYSAAKEVRNTLNVLYNTVKFLQTYCEANKYKPKEPKKFDISSQWILSRLQSLKQEVVKDLNDLKPHLASYKIEEFFLNDLSRWYGHIIREHIKPGLDSEYKDPMLYTFYKVCLETLKILAPFLPFITEDLYQDFFKKFEKEDSIHFCDWPEVEKEFVNEKLENEMKIARQIIEAANALRHERNVKLKYVLSFLIVDGKEEVKEAAKDLKEVIEELSNIKEVKIGEVEEGKEIENGKISLNMEITDEIKNEWLLSELIRSIQDARKKMNLEIKERVDLYLSEEDLFKKNKHKIEGMTGSKITFGKLVGKEFELEFENKKYEFGIKA